MSVCAKKLAFEAWYGKYNPELEMAHDDALDELEDCFYTAWEQALRVEHELNHLQKLRQDFDNG